MTTADRFASPPAPTDFQEQLWVRKARQGDLASFNQLVLAYQRRIFSLAYRLLGNAEDAADAAQETFVSAFRGMGQFRGGAFRPWLMRIAANACHDQLRRRQRRRADSLEALVEDENAPGLPADPGPGPEASALAAETVARLEAAILALPPEQRTVLVLSDVQGLSYEELAQALELSLGTVKSRLSRGRGRVRELLGGILEPEG